MPTGEKVSLVWLGLLLLIFITSYLPAPNPQFWFLRVGIPEYGWALGLAALPALAWLARKSPYVAAALGVVLFALMAWPWAHALAVRSTLPEGIAKSFGDHLPQRDPLILGSTAPIEMTTEEYKPGLEWDRYSPADGNIKARILFVHGGSWRNGTRQDYPQMFEYLAGRGYQVNSLTYRLAPDHPYPAAPEDISTAISKLSGDELPLVLAGRSSGGHLALLAAYTHSSQVDGVVGIYPPVDMVWSYEHPSNPSVLDSREAIVEFLGGTPLEVPDTYREASPIHRITDQTPPTLLVHGDRDCLVYLKQSQMLSAALSKSKISNYLLRLPWTEHGGDITIHGPTGRLTCWAFEAFLNSLIESKA